jgi:hypothetical protein
MSEHTITLNEFEKTLLKDEPENIQPIVDSIINMFNSNTREQTHKPSGIIHIVFNRNVKRNQRNEHYTSILQFLLLTYKDAGFPTIREAIRKLFIWPSLKIKLKINSLSEYIPIPSFYALEFTLVCMNWVNIHIHNNDLYTELKAALDGFDNSHSIISAPICQFFYYTDDNVSYHIVNNIFGSCLQIYIMLSNVSIPMFTTFSINRLLSSYMWGINRISDDWYSPDDFISGIEECSLNVENRQEPYKRYTFFKDKYKDIKHIEDILEIIKPVSLLQSVTPAEQSIPYMWVMTTKARQRELNERLKKKSLSKSKGSKRGGKKKRTRRTRRH